MEHHHQESSKRSMCDKLSLQLHLADAQIHLTSACEQLRGAGQGRELSRAVALHPTSCLTSVGAQPFPACRASSLPEPRGNLKLSPETNCPFILGWMFTL